MLVQACIHAGEVCGKDAGLRLLRDIAIHKEHAELLEGVTVLFIPIYNADGHERFGPHNRINQNGPREAGWRTSAQNLDLNRDHLKADAPETRAWLRLFEAWLPDFFVDVHSTDGADYQYPLTYAMEIHGNLDPGLTRWSLDFIGRIEERMEAAGWPLFPYISFRDWNDPRSGLGTGAAPPRFSQGYAALQNRPGLLVEAHMLKPYAARVEGTQRLLIETLEYLRAQKDELRSLVREADARVASPGFLEKPFPLRFQATDTSREVEFLGVEYDVVESDLSGGMWVRYQGRPVTSKLPYYDDVVPSTTVRLPPAYVVPPEWTDVLDRLRLHGVRWKRLSRETRIPVVSCRFRDVRWDGPRGGGAPHEGRQVPEFTATAVAEERTLPAGSAVIPLGQRTARVIVHALEPQGPDSFVRWGFFNAIFQRAEYAEAYVLESMARRMLESDPELAGELEAAKRGDPAFAASPRAILEWFYRRTPYHDSRHDVYPVVRIEDATVLDGLPLRADPEPAGDPAGG